MPSPVKLFAQAAIGCIFDEQVCEEGFVLRRDVVYERLRLDMDKVITHCFT